MYGRFNHLSCGQGPRSKWDQLEEDEESGRTRQPPTSSEVQSAGTAARGSAAVSMATKTATVRTGGPLDDRVRALRQWEAEGQRERGRIWDMARKAASPVCKEPTHASPGDADRAHKPSGAGRGPWRPRDRQGSGEQRAPQALDKDRKRDEAEVRPMEREQASDWADSLKRGPSSPRASSSSRTASNNKRLRDPEDRRVVRDPEDRRVVRDPEDRRVVRDPEDRRKRKHEHERCSGGNSQTSSSCSSRSSSSSSFSQPDAYSQRTTTVVGGISAVEGSNSSSGRRSSSRYIEHDTQAHQEPPDRRADPDALKYHQHQQHRRYPNQDHQNPQYHPFREHEDPLQPRGWPPALLASGHVRADRGGPGAGGAQAVADRGQDRPCRSDVFSQGWDAPLRPRKPIDIKIIRGTSLFQHDTPEKKNRL